MKEYLNKITQGDCLDLLKKLPSESIAGCITDPPYNYEFIGKSWDYDEIQRRINNTKINNSKTLVKNIPYGSGLSGGVRNKNWYRKNRENIIEYRKWVEKWADEIYRVLKPGSYALIVLGRQHIYRLHLKMWASMQGIRLFGDVLAGFQKV